MNIFLRIQRIQLLNKLISEQRTGTPESLAKRLGISRAKLYLLLEEMKDIGVEVHYSKRTASFYYSNCERLSFEFSFSVIDGNDCKNIDGGKMWNFIPTSNFLDGTSLS
ncbi:DNA-binding protein [Echinicola sediminis]